MASMQCYRSCSSESYETNHHEKSSLTHKVSDMVGKVFHGGNNHNHNKDQSLCHGQTTHHNNNHHHHQQQGQYGHNNHHKLGHQCGAGCTCSNHGNNYNHGHDSNMYEACSSEQYGNGDYEVRKMKMTVKNKSHSRRNNNCDDGSDSSGSDSD